MWHEAFDWSSHTSPHGHGKLNWVVLNCSSNAFSCSILSTFKENETNLAWHAMHHSQLCLIFCLLGCSQFWNTKPHSTLKFLNVQSRHHSTRFLLHFSGAQVHLGCILLFGLIWSLLKEILICSNNWAGKISCNNYKGRPDCSTITQ